MSAEKPTEKDRELKKLSKEHFREQIQAAENTINQARNQIQELQNYIQRESAIIGYAKHILSTFELPEKVEEPKEEKKPPELEVK